MKQGGNQNDFTRTFGDVFQLKHISESSCKVILISSLFHNHSSISAFLSYHKVPKSDTMPMTRVFEHNCFAVLFGTFPSTV